MPAPGDDMTLTTRTPAAWKSARFAAAVRSFSPRICSSTSTRNPAGGVPRVVADVAGPSVIVIVFVFLIIVMIVVVITVLVMVLVVVTVVMEAAHRQRPVCSGTAGSGSARSSDRTISSRPATSSVSVDPHGHRNTGTSIVVAVPHVRHSITAGMWLIDSTEPASGVSVVTISHE